MPQAPPEAAKKPPAAPQKDAKPAGGKDAQKPGGKEAAPAAEKAKDSAKQDGVQPQPGAKDGGKQDAGKQAAGERLDRMAVRPKMAVSAPGDAVEQEADQVADKVMRAMERDGAQKPARRDDAPAISRAPKEDAGGPARPTVPRDFAKDLGAGMPLDAATRGAFEQRFGHDFSRVRIHDDAKADGAARQIGARAFTLGDHIAFASGEYEPGTPEGRRLLAHELTHVVQQADGVARMVMRTPVGGGAATGATEFQVTGPLQIPPIKARHSPAYAAKARSNVLRRPRAYNAATRGTNQVGVWNAGVQIRLTEIPAAHRPASGSPWSLPLQQAGGAALVGGANLTAADDAALKELLKRPAWDADGNACDFQVDHMVEFQLGGHDDMSNFELLNQTHNGSVGSSFSHEINRAIREELKAHPSSLPAATGVTMPAAPDAEFVKQNYDVVFKNVPARGRESARREGGSLFWSLDQIEAAAPVTQLLPPVTGSTAGTAQRITVLSPTGNLAITRFPVQNGAITVPAGAAGGIAGFRIATANLTVPIGSLAGTTTAVDTPVGQLEGELDLGPAVTFPAGQRHALALQKATSDYAVKIASTPTPGANGTTNLIPATFVPLSPMEITGLTLGRGVYASATVQPTHPALAGLRIPGQIRNGRVGIFHTVDVSSLAERMNIPGLTVDGASVTIGYDGTDVSVGGSIGFSIRNFGQGTLDATLDSQRRFSLEGRFSADPRLFDQADMRLWYRSEEGFGGSGTLGITNPNKIRGIRSASVTARYERGVFHADGTVQPSLPGVQSAGLAVTCGADAGGANTLLIAGDLQLAAGIPGINGGSVHVTVAQRDDAWKVSASCTITPNLPGLSPSITLTYNDGLFDGTASARFARGIFSGNVTVGLTNRAVTPEGALSGTEPGEELRLYGEGSVTAAVTPWLSGSVGIKVRPAGTLLISGRIGIPAAVTVFDQYPAPPRDRRTLFSMPTVSVPLLGAPGAGVALNITGRVEGYARVGPGRLTAAEISVQDYDPAQPETLRITGRGTFEVPAAAGVDASFDAGLSAGAVISLEAGLGVTAGIGAEARVAPSVEIDWTQATGLHLHAALNASVSPKLRFSVRGYVRVVAGAFGVNYELWRKDWTLAQREAGGNLAIGVTVPVDYYSDGRGIVFDPNQVTFQVPSLNADTLRSLLNDNGEAQREEGEGAPPAH